MDANSFELKNPKAIAAANSILRYFTGAQAAAASEMITSSPLAIRDELIVACIAAAHMARKAEEAAELKEVNADVAAYLQTKAKIGNLKGFNISLIALAGHMLIACPSLARMKIVMAMRARMAAVSIWKMDKTKVMFSAQKAAVLADFAMRHPVTDDEIIALNAALNRAPV